MHLSHFALWARYRLVFAQSLSNFTCKLWKMRGGTWVTGSKVKVNFGTLCKRHCGQDTDYSFCPITFKLHMYVVEDERRNLINFGSQGKRSRSTLALCENGLVGTIQTTVYVQSLLIFTCKLWMMRVGTLLILGHRVIGQGQLCPLRGNAMLCVV